ncbi:hypothetical protein [Streptomyces sp. NBC_01789]|uniref:hypothetical protein n=1 Tax=Streptomyces sp. NBC_01789 TaxID=2975941 RepID=UPI00225C3BD8|nr:hypothetical protein [Streptomyces sp. NBC_01789]MCX4451250.1 hypothetical protein [Streptomyces sp. NBC_01789]
MTRSAIGNPRHQVALERRWEEQRVREREAREHRRQEAEQRAAEREGLCLRPRVAPLETLAGWRRPQEDRARASEATAVAR